jgi:hypothetical protein
MVSWNSSASSTPLHVILRRIIQECLCKGDACGLTPCRKFMNTQFPWHQIFYLHTFAMDKLHIRLPIKAIAGALNLQPRNIRHALQKATPFQKDVKSIRDVKTTPRSAYLNGLRRMPRIGPGFHIIAAMLSAEWLQRDGLILLWAVARPNFWRR